MDKSRKVAAIHILAGIIASPITGAISAGIIPGIGANQIFASLVGIVILYITGQITDKLYKSEDYGGFRKWLGDGIIPFGCIWFVLWTIWFNTFSPVVL
ncbi:MAG: DUF5379 domain-containing protein [Methanobrevibacter sp.]|jgi:hypothetical protein|nr:DUF5379 domain-containing protein [Candidatus Methanoflexus mossambicus]